MSDAYYIVLEAEGDADVCGGRKEGGDTEIFEGFD